MEKSQMKNIVVLRNLPSNVIEEAFVILKSNKYARKIEYIDKKENVKNKENKDKSNNYIIREAESVIANYIDTVEDKKTGDFVPSKKYKKIKLYSIAITIAFLVVLIF